MINFPYSTLQVGTVKRYGQLYFLLEDVAVIQDSDTAQVQAAHTDPVTIADAISSYQQRHLADVFNTQDQLQCAVSLGSADAFAVSEQLTVVIHFNRQHNDLITVMDVSRATVQSALSDPAILVDALFPYQRIKPLTDAFDVQEQLQCAILPSAADAFAVSEQLTYVTHYSRNISDLAVIADSTRAAIQPCPVDFIVVADHAALQGGMAVADTTIIQDQLTATAQYTREIKMSFGLKDQSEADIQPSHHDGISVSDQIITSKGVFVPDIFVVDEQLSRIVAFIRTQNDPAVIADWLTKTGQFLRTQSDPVAIDDTAVITVQSSQAETISISDTITIQKGYALPDTVQVSEQLSSVAAFTRTQNDPAVITDQLTKIGQFSRAQSEQVVFVDVTTITGQSSQAETITISDLIVLQHGYSLPDTVQISEQLSIIVAFIRAQSDPVAMTDQLTKTGQFSRAQTEQVVLIDVTTITGQSLQSETITISDLVVLQHGYALPDTVQVNEQLSIIAAFIRAQSDPVSITDQLAKISQFSRAQSEQVEIVDATTSLMMSTPTDTITVVDNLIFTIFGGSLIGQALIGEVMFNQ